MLSREHKIEIRRAYANGEKIADIAKKYYRTNGAIYAVVSDLPSRGSGEEITEGMINDIAIRKKPGPKPKPLPPAAILAGCVNVLGDTVAELAEEFSTSALTVYKALKREGEELSADDQKVLALIENARLAKEAAKQVVTEVYRKPVEME